MYLISSCLVGVNCRYNGTSTCEAFLKKLIDEGKAISVCPEVLAGLPTPRESCEIITESPSVKVKSKTGSDFTKEFKTGASKVLEICKQYKVTTAILQSRSPSCGFGKIYSGEFDGKLIEGNGVTADLLFENSIKIYNESNWELKEG
ncbi:DUF523 domain-containing protein [Plebeiibacterium marinum]|uniref:DUF523 domain-containing protein n=1 Tax=Plebeiibacterium marinum TaxID=2992111 RepID=A0AAE3SLM2_9BACT|nr:DUF523 domain-containing protein [Plebeiobacterium marinum]MCW3807624.1 DUF523 domain-containing protein [Plebeiobacterium marinum]